MFRAYIAALVGYARSRIVLALVLMLLLGLTEGIGLLMLVPFLHLVGLTEVGGAFTGVVAAAGQVFAALGLPLTLPVALGVFVFLIVSRAWLVRWRDMLLTEIRLGFIDHLRVRLYSAIGQANWLFLARRRGADLTHTLTSDIDRVGNGTYFFLTLAVTTTLAVVHVIVAFRLSSLMTAVTLGTGVGLMLLLWPQVRRARRLGEQLTAANRDVFRTVTDFLDGIKLAKSYGLESSHCQAFRQAVLISRRRALSFARRNASAIVVYQVGAALALSALLYAGVELIELPAADLLVLALVFARLLPMLSRLQLDYQAIVHMLPAFGSVRALTGACESAVERLPGHEIRAFHLRREIRLSGVGFSYPGQKERSALNKIDLVIAARKTTALVGPSGAGKTTLADLLMGLLVPDTGGISVDGQLLAPEKLGDWRRSIAYVPQETFLFHDTIRANLQWAKPEATDEELWAVLALVAAADFVAKLDVGLDTVLGDRGVRLSGGERQRLALARALLRKPSLLILDEATSALDTEHELRIQQAIDDLHGELTIVVVAHRLSTIRHADRIVVLEAGRVVESGSWDDLASRAGGRLRALLAAEETISAAA